MTAEPHPHRKHLTHGMVHASAETLQGPRASDFVDVVPAPHAELSLVLLDLRIEPPHSHSVGTRLKGLVRTALGARAALHEVTEVLRGETARHPGLVLGTSIVRFCQADSRVEVLNAGMPPIACALPGGSIELHVSLSGSIGEVRSTSHSYELLPLIWGSTWLVPSDGLTGGSSEPAVVRTLCDRLGLAEIGLALAQRNPDELYDLVSQLAPRAGRFATDDATLMLAGADPNARFESGVPR